MSQGAIFKLVLRDERFDKFFTASDYLRQRLDAIRQKRKSAGEANIQPTFADIEKSHILYIHASYRPYVSVASEYARVKASGDGCGSLGPGGGTLQFTIPTHGHFTSDIAIHIRFKPIGDPNPKYDMNNPVRPIYFRYCALPGLRLFKKIELRSDQVLIDEYDRDDAVAYSKFFIHADEQIGWKRCHGQEEVCEATYFRGNHKGSFMYRNGPQTPKYYQEGLDLFVPLQFWFCRDASHAMLNDLIPNSQRTITCELAPLNEIIQALSVDQFAFGETDLTPVDLPFSKLEFEAELYVNGLYVNPEIHDIFASRIGFSLIRVHRHQKNQLQHVKDSFLLDQLKFPAEYLLVGFRDRNNSRDYDNWWLMGVSDTNNDQRIEILSSWYDYSTNGFSFLKNISAKKVTTNYNFIDTIGVTAHGIEIYPEISSVFYNAYMPNRYAESSLITSPVDAGEFLVNFCLYPGQFNPSGYYNLSAGRELYINYTTKQVGSPIQPGQTEMVVSMSALNFLIRKGDRISLRYSV